MAPLAGADNRPGRPGALACFHFGPIVLAASSRGPITLLRLGLAARWRPCPRPRLICIPETILYKFNFYIVLAPARLAAAIGRQQVA